MSKLDKMGSRSISRPVGAGQSPTVPPRVGNPPTNATHSFSPTASHLPQRELRIKVWEDAETTDLVAPAEQQNEHVGTRQNGHKEEEVQSPYPQATPEEDNEVEDLPTTPMPSTMPPGRDQKPLLSIEKQAQQNGMNGQSNAMDRADADLPTRPLAVNSPPPNQAQPNRSEGRPFPAQVFRQTAPPQSPPGQAIDQQRQGFPVQADPLQRPIVQRPVTPALPISYPGFQQAIPAPAPAAIGIAAGPSPSRPVRRKSKMRLTIVLVLLLVLLIGGFATWDIIFQPFSVPAVTQTSLSFDNTDLGIDLHYPQGWTAKLDQTHQAVSFFDANHTDQVNVLVAAINGQTIDAYVNKEVAQLGLTAQKDLPPLTFAGTNWQQDQGTALVSGATYTETLLVAVRGDHFYAIAQMAPTTTYAAADHLFFSILRASFQFL